MLEDDYERAYHKGYVDRTKNVIDIINNIEIEYNLIPRLRTEAVWRALFRKLRKRVKDSGIVKLPQTWER